MSVPKPSELSPAETQLLIHHVPKDLKKAFKRMCRQKRVTMREAIIRFMQVFADAN